MVKQAAGRLDLEAGRAAPVAQVQDQAARPEAERDGLVAVPLVLREVVELAAAVEAQHAAVPKLELGAGRAVGPQPVAGQQGRVERRLLGPRVAGPLESHPRVGEADPPVVRPVVLGPGRGGQGQQRRA